LPVEEVLKPHVYWLASKSERSNDLIHKVGALGGHFDIVSLALLEVLLGPFHAFVLGGTKIPLFSGSALQAAAEQIELLVHIIGIFLVVLVPSYKKLLLEVRYGVGQCILGAEQTSVGGNIAGHFSSTGCRPLHLDGRQLAHAILNRFFWLTPVIELNPLGIPIKGGLVDSLQQCGHGGTELISLSIPIQVSVKAVITVSY